MENVYFDYNATAPLRPRVIEAMREAMDIIGNPSSIHAPGRQARKVIEKSRDTIKKILRAEACKIIFTSSGTEANNLALLGKKYSGYFISAIEHDSVRMAVPQALLIPVNIFGQIDLDFFEQKIKTLPAGSLVSVMLANNETGVIQPVPDVIKLAHNYGILVHCDITQAVGRLDINYTNLNADLLSFSGHKVGGPKGSGVLVMAPHLHLNSLMLGGGQESGYRAGTENLVAIAGLEAALLDSIENLKDQNRLQILRNLFEKKLDNLSSKIVIHGRQALRLSNTSCFSIPGISSMTQIIHLDLAGIAVSAGSACSSGKVKTSHVLNAMNVPENLANSAIRVSMGWNSQEKDIEYFISVWSNLIKRF
ncbi:MAG: cysteine desulfurase [Alphaproteobacteria bacterium]|nr:cysteine desulfurase [Alphaproteobacteria bacterium]